MGWSLRADADGLGCSVEMPDYGGDPDMFSIKLHYDGKFKKRDGDVLYMGMYGEEILRSNPGSTVKIKSQLQGVNEAVFQRIYICFHALKVGMLFVCRKIIFLDGAHIKTLYKGVVLTAIGMDANNGMFPFAYTVVEKETFSSWSWFLEIMVQDLGIDVNYKWSVMSDKRKGLIEAVSQLLPDSEHIFCAYHLWKNYNKLHKGTSLRDLLWKTARATRVSVYKQALDELKKADVRAHD